MTCYTNICQKLEKRLMLSLLMVWGLKLMSWLLPTTILG